MIEKLAPAKLFDLVPGAHFQNCELLEQIGSGGQGVVWSAVDLARKQVVAIKFNEINETAQGVLDDQLVERQSKALIALSHPNILPIFDIGHQSELRYFISPYVGGGMLQLKRVHSLADTFRYLSEICSALDYLHSQDIIHRDLKPSNILLDLQHNTYLADFGLARIVTATTDVLHTGRGTPPYSPPEQHTLKKITAKSDLYSLGIIIYEFFTHQLPWKGEQVLGMLQLYSQEQMPDPREIDPSLPSGLVTLLRQVTCADPAQRPGSAMEILEAVTRLFEFHPVPVPTKATTAELTDRRRKDAAILLKKKYAEWDKTPEELPISLTHFALLDLYMHDTPQKTIPGELQYFMLQGALTYGYRSHEWWKLTDNINNRLFMAMNLIDHKNPAVGRRVLNAITSDPQVIEAGRKMSAEFSARLLDLAGTTSDPDLQKKALMLLRRLSAPAQVWKDLALPPGQDYRLATLAVPDTEQADEAARLIGHLRSASAVATAYDQADPSRRGPLLLEVQAVAGNLPPSIPGMLRLSTAFNWILAQVSIQPMVTLATFALIFLGILLGFGTHVYLTYRLPTFMDLTRILISLERGAFMGLPLGFGLLVTRLLVERLGRFRYRLLIGTATGWLVTVTSFVIYDLLILNNLSLSPGILLGSLLIAFGFAIGSLTGKVGWRFVISLVAVYGALAGSWWLYLAMSKLGMASAPLLYYEFSWTTIQVLGSILLVSVPVALLANLVSLMPKKE
jgi:serine/threonine protein kinase